MKNNNLQKKTEVFKKIQNKKNINNIKVVLNIIPCYSRTRLGNSGKNTLVS